MDTFSSSSVFLANFLLSPLHPLPLPLPLHYLCHHSPNHWGFPHQMTAPGLLPLLLLQFLLLLGQCWVAQLWPGSRCPYVWREVIVGGPGESPVVPSTPPSLQSHKHTHKHHTFTYTCAHNISRARERGQCGAGVAGEGGASRDH